MTVNFKLVQTPAVALYTGLSGTGTSMTITPYPKDLDGTKLAMTDFGTIGRCTVDPKVSGYEEIISFTGMTDNGDNTCTLTGLTRDLISKYPYTTAGTGKVHGASAIVVFSDNPQAYSEFGMLRNDNAWSGVNAFSVSPTMPSPTNATDGANKSYVDTGLQAGGTDMSTTVKGVGRDSYSPNKTIGTFTVTIASPAVFTLNAHGLTANDTVQFTTTGALPTGISASTTYFVISTGLSANAFEISATLGGAAINSSGSQSGVHTCIRTTPYVVSDNDPRLAPNNYTVATGSANAFVVTPTFPITAYVTGQDYVFNANFTITSATTVAISGLTAKTIKKLDGVTDLVSGDIVSGMTVQMKYDGINMIMLNPVANAPISTLVFGDFGDGSDGDVTIAAGTTTISRDMYYNSLVIQTGGTLNPTGYRIFVKTTLTFQGTGKIARNGSAGTDGGAGGNASGGTPGAAGAAGTGGASLAAGTIAGAPAGGNGAIGLIGVIGNSGSGNNGGTASAPSAVTNGIGSTSGAGAGIGGNGGASFNGVGGSTGGAAAGGAVTVTNPKMMPRTSQNAISLHYYTDTTFAFMNGSAAATGGSSGGSGSGGNQGTGNSGGGSGGGGGAGGTGGIVMVAAYSIIGGTTTCIQALGGAAGNGGVGGNGSANYAGGGGGGAGGNGGTGGVVVLVYHTYSGTALTTACVAGGAGGAGATFGTGGASGGSPGTAGTSGATGATGKLYTIAI